MSGGLALIFGVACRLERIVARVDAFEPFDFPQTVDAAAEAAEHPSGSLSSWIAWLDAECRRRVSCASGPPLDDEAAARLEDTLAWSSTAMSLLKSSTIARAKAEWPAPFELLI